MSPVDPDQLPAGEQWAPTATRGGGTPGAKPEQAHGASSKTAATSGSEGGRHPLCDPVTVLVIALWFLLNISISTLTKWIFLNSEVCASGYGCQRYEFPLAVTVIHLLISQMVCTAACAENSWIPALASPKAQRTELRGWAKLYKVGPLAACFAASIGMGNLSLGYIYPSFKQMVGSAGPVVTVTMSVLFTNKRYNTWTWASMPLICGGLVLCGNEEVNFSVLGVLLSVAAMVLRSAKSIIQAQLLGKSEKIEPLLLLNYMAPYASMLIWVMSLAAEGLRPYALLVQAVADRIGRTAALGASSLPSGVSGDAGSGVYHLVALLLLSGLNACFLNLLGFVVLRCTSPVQMQVLGSVKSCLGIAVSVLVLGNPLHPRQMFGVAVCLVGVFVYEHYGSSYTREKAAGTAAKKE